MRRVQELVIFAEELALILSECPEITPEESDSIRMTAALMEHCFGVSEGYMVYVEPPCYPEGIDRTMIHHICAAMYRLGK